MHFFFLLSLIWNTTLEEKEKGITNDILEEQLKYSIPISSNFENSIIAYEPVWAIGTGLTPTNEEINDTHSFIKGHNAKFNKYKVIYGGSVKSSNFRDKSEISEKLNKVIEKMIEKNPKQWIWTHDRWK